MNLTGMVEGAANLITGGVYNTVMNQQQDARQLEQQKRLNREQLENTKELGVFNAQQSLGMTRAQWAENVKGMKEAGLNPSMMYAKGGGGGMTAPTATTQGATASDSNAATANNIQLAMAQANTRLMNTQADKNEVEAQKIAGVDTELATQNTAIAKAAAEVANESIQNQITRIAWEAQEQIWKASEQQTKGIVNAATVQEQISQIKTEAAGAILNNALTKEKITLTKEEQNKIITEIQQNWARISQGQEQNEIRKFAEEIRANYPSMMQMTGHALQQITYGIADIFKERQGQTEQENRAVKFKK